MPCRRSAQRTAPHRRSRGSASGPGSFYSCVSLPICFLGAERTRSARAVTKRARAVSFSQLDPLTGGCELQGSRPSVRLRLVRDGNARIRDRSFAVPSSCLAPIVLVHPEWGHNALHRARRRLGLTVRAFARVDHASPAPL